MKQQAIKRALLNAYRKVGRIRIPLPALVCFAMRELRTNNRNYLEHFQEIHKFLRANWGNGGLFSRRRGLQGGIALRPHVNLK